MPELTAPTPSNADNITCQFDNGRLQTHDTTVKLGWPKVLDAISQGGTFWLTSVDADGRPHTRPVFAVCADGNLVTTSSATAAKSQHLRAGRPTSIGGSASGLDIVWAGVPHRITDHDALVAVANAYRTTIGWDVDVDPANQALTAPYGAPTAGPPPYEAFRIEPTAVHAIVTTEELAGRSTRWDFP